MAADPVKDSILPLGRPLFDETESMDFEFVVDGKSIKAHKPVICARSPVLKAMFNRDYIETRKSQMEIPDFEYSVVETAVKFFYYGEFDIKTTNVVELVRFIDKYDVVTLKVRFFIYENVLTTCFSHIWKWVRSCNFFQ